MSVSRNAALCAAGALLLGASAAQAAPLAMANVGAPAINCVFDPSCKVVATDSIGGIPNAAPTSLGRLQSRTWAGAAGAPANGLTAYLYRIDLTSVAGSPPPLCVSGYRLAFGPVATLPYAAGGGRTQVFVVTSGALGSIAPTSADLTGTTLTFTFATPVCAGQNSFFFGVAARNPPVGTDADIRLDRGGQSGWTNVAVRSANP